MNSLIRSWNNIFTEHISVHEVGMQGYFTYPCHSRGSSRGCSGYWCEPESLEIGFEPNEVVQQALPEVKTVS